MKRFFLLLALTSSSALAAEKKIDLAPPILEAKAPDKLISVKESLVLLGDKKYRRIEYKNDVFYLRLQSLPGENSQDLFAPKKPVGSEHEMRRECLKENLPKDNRKARILGEVKVTEVTSIYLEGLHNECESLSETEIDAHLGLKLKTGEHSDLRIGIEKGPASPVTPKATLNLGF